MTANTLLKGFNRPTFLFVLVLTMGVLGSAFYFQNRIAPGTYVIMSRTLRQRESGARGVERCWVAAYRWRLGSHEKPRWIGSVESLYDCYSGFEVRENRLYRREYQNGITKEVVLGVNGKIEKTSAQKEALPSTVSGSTSAVKIESLPEGYADVKLRITDGEGRVLRERTFGGRNIAHVSPDHSTVYLEISEIPDGYNGPWPLEAYDWKNDHLESIAGVENSRNYDERAFELGGNRLLYVKNKTIRDPEGHGWNATSPSSVNLLDLDSGENTVLRSVAQGDPFSKPRFSPDGKRYVIETPGADTIYDLIPNGPPLDTIVPKITDWFDDTIVIHEFELLIHDLNTKKNTVLSSDYASFDYVGRIVVP